MIIAHWLLARYAKRVYVPTQITKVYNTMTYASGKSLKTLFTAIIIVLLTIGLTLFMITDVFTSGSANSAASVGDDEVTLTDFKSAFDNRLQLYNQDNGTRLTPPEAYQQGFATQILNMLITQKAMENDAVKLGVGVSGKVIISTLEQYPAFQDELTGEYDEAKIDSYLNSQRQSRDDFEAMLTSDLTLQQTSPAIASGIKAPAAYASQRYKFLTEQRKVSLLTVGRDAMPTPERPDDETLKAHIADNIVNYTAPEYRAFTILRIEQTDLYPDLEVDEAEVRELYEYKLATNKLGSPETRSLVMLNATNETLANDAIKLLQEGRSPEQVTVALGFVEPTVYTDTLVDDILDSKAGEAAFNAAQDEIIAVEGALSWYVVQVTGIIDAVSPNYDDLKTELANELKADKAIDSIYDITAAIEDAIGEGVSLEDAAKANGASLSSIDLISRLGRTQADEILQGIGSITGVSEDDKILTELFTSDLDYETDFFETSKGGYAILRVDEIVDSAPYPFETVKDQATFAWMNKQYDTALGDLARAIAERARAGESLSEINDSFESGVTLDDIIMVRSSRADGIGPVVTTRLFEASVGEIVQGDGADALTRNIATVTDVIGNTDALVGGYADAMQTQISSALSQDINQAYQSALLRESDVQIFDDKIRAILGVTE